MAGVMTQKEHLVSCMTGLINRLYRDGVDVPEVIQLVCQVVLADRAYNDSRKPKAMQDTEIK